jgi:2-iminobutanoate/2-iminopropanoate deaminase
LEARKNFNTDKVIRLTQVFPQAVIAGDFIFVSGTTGIDPSTGKLISDSFEQQTRQALLNIKTILEEAGSGMDKVVKTTVWMVTGNEFPILNKVYIEFFSENAPVRSAPQVMPFPGGVQVSIECIAMI